jgi:SAM-dependent methyltransferase
MHERGRFTGMWLIVRFNWPLYAAALIVLVFAVTTGVLAGMLVLKLAALAVALGAVWFLAGSLAASHLVYDRSDLHRGAWLARALPSPPYRVAVCHCGYDEVSGLLRERLSASTLRIFDHYDEATMSEPSIHRARRLFPPAPGTVAAPHKQWPAEDGVFDAIVGALAIHELRTHQARADWFSEARRCLAPGGRIVIVEHLRDAANFVAFGPGFVHFHSAATWQRSWECTGLRHADDFRITPFVRVFVLCSHD